MDVLEMIRDRILGGVPKTNTLQNLIPVESFEKDYMVMRSGRVVVGYKVKSPLMERWDAAQLEQAARQFTSSFKSLPAHSIIQKIDYYYYDYNSKEKDLKSFESRFLHHFLERPKLKHECYFFLISPTNNNEKRLESNNLFSRPNLKKLKKDFDGISERIDDWRQTAQLYIQEIGSIDTIQFLKIDDDEAKEIYRKALNLEFRFDPGMASRAIHNGDSTLTVGEKKVNVLSLTGQAKEIYPFRKNEYGVDCSYVSNVHGYYQKPHIVCTSYWIENTEEKLKEVEWAKTKSNSLAQFNNEEAQLVVEEITELTGDIRKEQKMLISMAKNVIVWSQSDNFKDVLINEILGETRRWQDANMIVESYCNGAQFFACLPGNAAENIRYLLMPSDIGACYQEWTTTDWPMGSGDLFTDRFRNPVRVPVYNPYIVSQNGIVVGPTGSGKSYFMNHLVYGRFYRRERQIIIDVGGTYKNTIEDLGGRYFKYDPEHPMSFNPFLCTILVNKAGKKYYELTEDKISFLKDMFGLIWKNEALDQDYNNILEIWINEYYRTENDRLNNKEASVGREKWLDVPSLHNFYFWLLVYSEEQKQNESFIKQLNSFNKANHEFDRFLTALTIYVEGSRKELLNSSSKIDISDEMLVCFDMAGVKDNKSLYPLVTMLLTELTLDVIRKYKHDIKHFIMDEAWSMLTEGMGSFVEYLYRTIRKENGSIFIITQGIGEIVNSKAGAAIINNSLTRVILNHTDDAVIEQLGVHLSFNSLALDKIRSLRKDESAREFFIQQENHYDVFALEVPLEEHVFITSNPRERNHFNDLKKKMGGNVQAAVTQWVIDKKSNVI